FIMSGCASYNPIPEGYSGQKASIQDSALEQSSQKADFFYVESVDGHDIENSVIVTSQANRGRGFSMTPKTIGREIPARLTTLKIVGRTVYAAPILDLTNTVYQVKGNIQFTPEANKFYTIKGELGESYSAVWVEEYGVGAVAGTKIEIRGSAKLGTFEK
ncbi:MAG: hypothetical protein WAX04_11715, partial [Oscillospiraceae bacterium]